MKTMAAKMGNGGWGEQGTWVSGVALSSHLIGTTH
jgi:hypothetical protein